MAAGKPAPPGELGPRGRKFWRLTVAAFELETEEFELLRECCRTLDTLDALDEAVRADGVTVRGSEGQPRSHPALGELRGARLVLARLLKQLALPEVEQPVSEASKQARAAAQERWRLQREKEALHGT